MRSMDVKRIRARRLLASTALAAALLVIASCRRPGDGPPSIVVDRTACSHCGMLISELAYAAAYQPAGSEGRVFDDIGCLVQAAGKETGTAIRFWFHDVSSGEWIEGDAATFAAAADIRTPMGGGILAFRDPADATRAARDHRGRVVRSVSDLIGNRGDS